MSPCSLALVVKRVHCMLDESVILGVSGLFCHAKFILFLMENPVSK